MIRNGGKSNQNVSNSNVNGSASKSTGGNSSNTNGKERTENARGGGGQGGQHGGGDNHRNDNRGNVEETQLTDYDKYLRHRELVTITNNPIAFDHTLAPGRGRVKFNPSKLNNETLMRIVNNANLHPAQMNKRAIQASVADYWHNMQPKEDQVLARAILKIRYQSGLESSDLNTPFDSEDEAQLVGWSSDGIVSDEDNEPLNSDSNSIQNSNSRRTNSPPGTSSRPKRALPSDTRFNIPRTRRRLNLTNVEPIPDFEDEATYEDPSTYLNRHFRVNNLNSDIEDENVEAPEEDNDSSLDPIIQLDQTASKQVLDRANEVENLREESNYMIEDDTQEDELDQLDQDDNHQGDQEAVKVQQAQTRGDENQNINDQVQTQVDDTPIANSDNMSSKDNTQDLPLVDNTENDSPTNLKPESPKSKGDDKIEELESNLPKDTQDEITKGQASNSSPIYDTQEESKRSPTPKKSPTPEPQIADSKIENDEQSDEEVSKKEVTEPKKFVPTITHDDDSMSDISDLTNHESP